MVARERMTEMIAQIGKARHDWWWLNDIAFAITEGGDYDEYCQTATDEIARELGIAEPSDITEWEGTEYEVVNAIVNTFVEWSGYCEEMPSEEQITDVLVLAYEQDIPTDEAVWCVWQTHSKGIGNQA